MFANDPHAKTRFGIFLMWEAGVLIPIVAVSILLKSRNVSFNLWQNERVLFMIASGVFLLITSYFVPQIFEAVEKHSVKRKLLIYLTWWIAILAPVAIVQYGIMLSAVTLPIPIWYLVVYLIWAICSLIVAKRLSESRDIPTSSLDNPISH